MVRLPPFCVVIPPAVRENVLLALLSVMWLYVALPTVVPVVPDEAYSTVLVPGVNVPETVNTELPLPVSVIVLAPGAKVCEAAMVTDVAFADEPNDIAGVDAPDDIETVPTSCFVVLLSVQVLVPVGFRVRVPVPFVKVI